MSVDDGESPAHRPVGSRVEQNVIDDKLGLKAELKKAQDERDGRFRGSALVGAFLAGFIVCDLVYGGKLTHRFLVMVDRMIHRNNTYDEE